MTSLLTETQMAHLTAERQAEKAIRHTLERIRDHPEIGYYMGFGTQSFSLLSEAAAKLWGDDVSRVRQLYMPRDPRDPYAKQETA